MEAAEPVTMAGVRALYGWLERATDDGGRAWLDRWIERSRRGGLSPAMFAAIYSQVPRFVGKRELPESEASEDWGRKDWRPHRWSSDQAARAILLLVRADAGSEQFERDLALLLPAADLGELVAFYQTLPLLPDPARHLTRATEGVRSNMVPVFESVALNNPYPAEQFGEGAWNQMVLKALFVGSPLCRIVGLDERCNPSLARMAADYARERWAAHRPISPELWRAVGCFAEGAVLGDLERALSDPSQQHAAALALKRSRDSAAAAILDRRPNLREPLPGGD